MKPMVGSGRGTVRLPVRPAAYTSAGQSCAALRCRLRLLGECPLEGVQRKERALETRRADLDAQQLQDVVLAQASELSVDRPRSVSVSIEADAWLMAQPRPVNETSLTVPASSRSSIRVMRSPHSGLEPSYDTSGCSSVPKLWGRR